jgi:hypothetical protein
MKVYGLVVLAACQSLGVPGSGKAKLEVRPVAAFSAVRMTGGIDAEVTLAETPRVELSGDDNLLPMITTTVTGDALEIRSEQAIRPKLPLIAHLATPRLTALEVHGAGDVVVHGARGDALALSVHGAGSIKGDGAVHELHIDIAGSGDVKLAALPAEHVSVTISGAGDVEVTASQTLDVQISGAGDVVFHGDARVTKHISGAGNVTRK